MSHLENPSLPLWNSEITMSTILDGFYQKIWGCFDFTLAPFYCKNELILHYPNGKIPYPEKELQVKPLFDSFCSKDHLRVLTNKMKPYLLRLPKDSNQRSSSACGLAKLS